MKVGIMQPYLFPYIGYFQLINAVDVFVFHDDVQYIKGGWINRNRILINTEPSWITLPVRSAPAGFVICQRRYGDQFAADKARILRRIEAAYRTAPCFGPVSGLLTSIFSCDERNVAAFNIHQIREICRFLAIPTRFAVSSEMHLPRELRGQARVLEINRMLGATAYINPPGGAALYQRADFAKRGNELSFLQPGEVIYEQFGGDFVPSLSIIDVMMFNRPERIRALLGEYTLQ